MITDIIENAWWMFQRSCRPMCQIVMILAEKEDLVGGQNGRGLAEREKAETEVGT